MAKINIEDPYYVTRTANKKEVAFLDEYGEFSAESEKTLSFDMSIAEAIAMSLARVDSSENEYGRVKNKNKFL